MPSKVSGGVKVFTDPLKLQKWAASRKLAGKKIALVPTMGYLHEGHLSLIRRAKEKGADIIVVSIFVNPVQFCPGEDFEKYPRDIKSDLQKCLDAGVTAVFAPKASDMYASDHSVYVNEDVLSKGLCGARRPGHFRGVCTVVAKLFNIVQPNFAFFGQKDYQQAQIIKRMARDLNFDIEIVTCPIVRESSGLAKSSRNTYLSDNERSMAETISMGLKLLKRGKLTLNSYKKRLCDAGLKLDYVEAVDSKTLRPAKKLKRGVCVLVAAYAGKTRLIDNLII